MEKKLINKSWGIQGTVLRMVGKQKYLWPLCGQTAQNLPQVAAYLFWRACEKHSDEQRGTSICYNK